MRSTPALALLCLAACRGPAPAGPQLPAGTPVVGPEEAQVVLPGDTVAFTVTGLDDAQAYRATLVHGHNLRWEDGQPVFTDADANGAADAGASTTIATLATVNRVDAGYAKTVPAVDDDPAAPSGIFPVGGRIEVEVAAVGGGTAWLVVYDNGGSSTFLELDDAGVPVERFGIGGAIAVERDGWPDVTPAHDLDVQTGESVTYTLTDLEPGAAYRVTLVDAANLSWAGEDAVFVDADASGTADAGASERVAQLTAVQGSDIVPAKTYPAGTDDPADPSGIVALDGRITVEVKGVGAGTIVPVAYRNGGDSTFLEVGPDGVPLEPYGVGGVLTVWE